MKKTILFCLGLILSASLFISCSDDDDNDKIPLPYIVAPKADVEFKGTNQETVKAALQGTWWVKKMNNHDYEEGTLWYMAIKGDQMIIYGGGAVDYGKEPKWYRIGWIKLMAEDGTEMHSFYPIYDDRMTQGDIISPFTPYRIKDNVLVLGISTEENPELSTYYGLVTEKYTVDV